MATPFAPFKKVDSIFEFAIPENFIVGAKSLHFLHRTEIYAILAYFCLNFVAMATPFAPVQIRIA